MLLHLLLMVLKEIVFVSVSFSSRNRNSTYVIMKI